MTSAPALELVAAVAHARHVPIAQRERFAREIRERTGVAGLLLETCHRVEWYGDVPGDAELVATAIPARGEILAGEAAARHALTVAVGLDSVVIGEDQLLHQLRRSVAAAREGRAMGASMDRLFALAQRAGRRARSWRQEPRRSLADVALALIELQTGSLRGRSVIVVGAGEMGRLAVRAASATGATVSVTSRTAGHVRSLAREAGVAATRFDPGPISAAAVVVALRGPWPISEATADSLAAGTAVIVDLSVPSAVPSELAARLGSRFISADDLASGDAARFDPAADLVRERELVDTTLAEFTAWHAGRDRRAVAQALAERLEHDRRMELEALWRRLPPLSPEDRDAIERMSRHLAERVLREPLERLQSDPDGRHERALRELFSL